jgi:hypothetical protein
VSWAEFHSKSEHLAIAGELSIRAGDLPRALELYRGAAEAEIKALEALPTEKRRTLGITAVSAVALWYKSREYAAAAKLAHRWLGDDLLPEFAIEQMNRLLELVWTAQEAERAGVHFVTGDVLVAVKGGEIVYGGAPLDLILRKIDEIKAVYFRTIEMLMKHPLRKRGMPSIELQEFFRPWLFQAPAGSYQFAVRVQEPPQHELFPEDRPSVERVTSTFMEIIRATASDPLNDLPQVVPDQEYRTTFLKLARNIAPTGKRYSQVEIRDASTPTVSPISMSSDSRDAINSALRKERPPVRHEEYGQIQHMTGILRAVHLDDDWIELTTDQPERPHVHIVEAGDVLDDVVGPMVNHRVTVTVSVGKYHKLSFRDIELDE